MLEDVKNRISEKSLRPGRNYPMLENRSKTPTESDFKGCATWLYIPARSRNNERAAGAFDPCSCGSDNKTAAHLTVGRRSRFTTQKYCAPDST
ncbi:Glycoprotein 3-alpha-L-fucosyltransferase [Trichinella spiralis]|uniref:Glycoprotein 3-alpha-L-fucosyltransferase n=1 Tax=Trichinella spiralis TaxID=6334 RepID=A0ABR3KEX5_TRISP